LKKAKKGDKKKKMKKKKIKGKMRKSKNLKYCLGSNK